MLGTSALFTLVLIMFGGEITQLYAEFDIDPPQTMIFGYAAATIIAAISLLVLWQKPANIEKLMDKMTTRRSLLLYFGLGLIAFLLVAFFPLYLPLYSLAGLL